MPKDAKKRHDPARQFAVEAARLAANTRCHEVVLLDVRNLSPVTDYFLIASGTSSRQMRSVIDELAELAKTSGYSALSSDGYEGETWILLDCVDVIIHVFNDQARRYYDLDNLWGDAKKIEWEEKK
jgi:ribosome-associated protein